MLNSRQVQQSWWFPEQARRIVKRFVIEGDLVLDTPAHFGTGDSNGTELLILEDTLEKKPLLPGASLAGALRHYLLRRERGYRTAETNSFYATTLFGEAYDEDQGVQSRVIVDDALALGEGPFLDIREGVKIEEVTRTADEGALFSVQVWLPGTRFRVRFELQLYADDDIPHLQTAFAVALDGLGTGEISVGTRKHRGYGSLHVENWRVAEYDLSNPNGLIQWLRRGNEQLTTPVVSCVGDELSNNTLFPDEREFVRVEARFGLEDTMLIRAGSDVSDMAHLRYTDGSPVLSGTSLAGALRARALKIMNTYGTELAQDFVDDLFGAHGSQGTAERYASRLIVSESVIHEPAPDHIQNRVKIDRFTGGAFETALFEQQPTFATDQTYVDIFLELRFPSNHDDLTDAEVGLLLLLLKDLWTGDLPLGGESNVGRGRLYGKEANVIIQKDRQVTSVSLVAYGPENPQDAEILEFYVDQLTMWLEGDQR